MRFLILFPLLFCLINNARSQDTTKCRYAIGRIIEDVSDGSTERIDEYLSNDFTVSGMKGEMAKMVLAQLFTQLKGKVVSSKEKDVVRGKNTLDFNYDINYDGIGVKNSSFRFNEENRLVSLNLIEMEIKSCNSWSTVEKGDQDFVEVPFRLMNHLIVIDVSLNGKKRAFMLDTGASKVVLNSQRLNKNDQISDPAESTVKAMGVNGSISGINIQEVASIDLNGIEMKNQQVLTFDLTPLEDELKIDLYGLIGYDFIKDYDILFDYKEKRIVLIEPQKFDLYASTELSKNELEKIPFNLTNHLPIISYEIGDTNISVGIDCGAEMTLVNSNLLASINKDVRKIKSDSLVGAGNTRTAVNRGKLRKSRIGNKTFKNLNIVFSDISHLNGMCGTPNMDGLIGYEVLSKQKTMLSFYRKELVFID